MRTSSSFGCIPLLVVYGAVFLVCGFIGGFLWPYTVNSWLEVAGKDPCLTYWHGFLMGMVPGVGQLFIPAAFITFVCMLFVS